MAGTNGVTMAHSVVSFRDEAGSSLSRPARLKGPRLRQKMGQTVSEWPGFKPDGRLCCLVEILSISSVMYNPIMYGRAAGVVGTLR